MQAKRPGAGPLCALQILLPIMDERRPDHNAILAPDRNPLTYAALWAVTNDVVQGLRSLGIGRRDRVAVVLPDGPEAAVAMISVAAGAVCVPLYPAFTADEWQRYFSELHIAALLTRADMDSASRGVAHTSTYRSLICRRGPARGPARSGLAARQGGALSQACRRQTTTRISF